MTGITVRLGYEVGTGDPVVIPLRHMVVTGQTQEAGKTTALEALIARSGVKAIAFITKRGEGSFTDARVIRPYFREQADWKYVAAILEASRGEKLKFERAWIIRASKGARTLAEVQRNVKHALETAKGMSADVYLTLDAYFDDVVPQIAQVRWAERVDLAAGGVSAMDLTGINVEMQHLVIRSTLEWVLNKEQDTIVVVPEAWKFIPQGRGTPVKLAAEAYIRQAAALRNYLWLDSQDIAGVEKMILKSVPVWILGVQRESNEVERTLKQIPEGMKKPKLEDVATLALGQFYACHGTHITKVYVQPRWMSEGMAEAIARGQMAVQVAAEIEPTREQEAEVNEQEARNLRAENAELRQKIGRLEEQIAQMLAGRTVGKQGAKMPEALASGRDVETPPSPSPAGLADEDALYRAIKRIVAETPELLRVLVTALEMEVQTKRETVTADGASWLGRSARLITEGFFDTPKRTGEVFKVLEARGAKGIPARADEAIKKLWAMGFLMRGDDGFSAVKGMKVNVVRVA